VVVDEHEAGRKAWKVQAWPYWLLLDAHGGVIEARFKPQTAANSSDSFRRQSGSSRALSGEYIDLQPGRARA